MTGPGGASAMLFPGMGPSRFADAGRFLLLNRHARDRRAVADEVLGHDVLAAWRESERAGGGDYAGHAQVVFLVACLALADGAVRRREAEPAFCVGASFGQKAAVVWSGALSYEDALHMTVDMARCEQEYFAGEHADVVTHSFLRVPDEALHEALDELDAAGEFHEVSGRIDDGFHLLSLRRHRLDWLKARITALGGYSMYTMWPPVHAPAFAGLRALVEREVTSRLSVADPRVPLVADADGAVVDTAEEVRAMLLDTVDRPLDWPAVVRTLRAEGVGSLLVAGADNLFRRVGVTTRAFRVDAVDPRTAVRAAS